MQKLGKVLDKKILREGGTIGGRQSFGSFKKKAFKGEGSGGKVA